MDEREWERKEEEEENLLELLKYSDQCVEYNTVVLRKKDTVDYNNMENTKINTIIL